VRVTHYMCYVIALHKLLSFSLLKMTRVAESKIYHYADEDSKACLGTDNYPS